MKSYKETKAKIDELNAVIQAEIDDQEAQKKAISVEITSLNDTIARLKVLYDTAKVERLKSLITPSEERKAFDDLQTAIDRQTRLKSEHSRIKTQDTNLAKETVQLRNKQISVLRTIRTQYAMEKQSKFDQVHLDDAVLQRFKEKLILSMGSGQTSGEATISLGKFLVECVGGIPDRATIEAFIDRQLESQPDETTEVVEAA